MHRSPADALQAIVIGVVLLLAVSAEPAWSVNAQTSFKLDQKSISDVDAYAWAPTGNTFFYAMSDGSIWSVEGPDFATPIRITRIALPDEQKIEQLVFSPDGRNIAVVSPRPSDLWDTIWLVNVKHRSFAICFHLALHSAVRAVALCGSVPGCQMDG